MPWAFSRWNIRRISSPVRESRLPVGSSARSMMGRLTRPRAMATRCILAAGHLRGLVVGPRRQPDLLEQRRGQLPRVDAGRPPQGVIQRHQDIVQGGSPRQEVEALEDEAQFRGPHQGPLVGRKAAHLLAVEPELAGTGPVEAAQNVHERGLARPGCPHQSYHLALGDGKGYTLQYGYVHFTKVVGFGDVFEADEFARDGCGKPSLCRGVQHFRITPIVAHRGINRQAHNGRRGEGGEILSGETT